MYYDIFIGVDGTGPASNTEYTDAFSKSFVKRLSEHSRFQRKIYLRGPTWDGIATGSLARAAAFAAKTLRDIKTGAATPRLFLCGYSRGGAAVIQAAHFLKADGIPVHALILFDAVARTVTYEKTWIPSNVAYSRHAQRRKDTDSRTSFGNCGTQKETGPNSKGANAKAQEFFTTHGGMGGTPWGAGATTSDGFITERAPGVSAALRVAVPIVGAGFPIAAVALAIGSAVYESTMRTKVSPKKDASGSQEVWNWMANHLSSVQYTRPTPSGWAQGNRI